MTGSSIQTNTANTYTRRNTRRLQEYLSYFTTEIPSRYLRHVSEREGAAVSVITNLGYILADGRRDYPKYCK